MTEKESMNDPLLSPEEAQNSENSDHGETRDDTAPDSAPGSGPLGDLLRGALADVPVPARSFLPGIQHRIRVKTRGKYFRDRWSTTRDPVSLLLMCALLILILVTALFLVMQPLVSAPRPEQLPTPAVDPMATEGPSAAPSK